MRRASSFLAATMLAAHTHSLASSKPSLKLPAAFPPLVLASKSPTRQLLLRELGFRDLTVVPADLDERAIGNRFTDQPAALVLAIAIAKAAAVQAKLVSGGSGGKMPAGALLLAGDQVSLGRKAGSASCLP
jgi:predicted house-cleaning NTP pyrophosphatase (Maf/HAM1 superfamily)